jgi:hypothetical protein
MSSSIPNYSEQEYKVLENKLRRAAVRQGLRLEKSRMRDPRAITFGTYRLIDESSNTVAAGDQNGGYGLTLDDIARHLGQWKTVDAKATLPLERFRRGGTKNVDYELRIFHDPENRDGLPWTVAVREFPEDGVQSLVFMGHYATEAQATSGASQWEGPAPRGR